MTSNPLVGAEIVERVAARESVDPTDLDVRLHDVIDADALEALAGGADRRDAATTLRIEFSFLGHAVAVDGTGAVTIDGRAAGPEADPAVK